MFLNPEKCHFMVLGDSNCTCNFTCNGTTIVSSKEKGLDIKIDDKLAVMSHHGNIIKKATKNLHALSRVIIKYYLGFEQNKLIMLSFIKSQFSFYQVIWTFSSRTSINNIQEKCLRLATNDYESNFNEILESSHELSLHKTHINYLMIEVYKYLRGLYPELIADIFTLKKNPYNIRNIRLFGSEYPRCVLGWMQQRFVLVSCGKKYQQQYKIFHLARLKNTLVCRHPTESTRNLRVKNLFLMLVPEKLFFSHKYIILAMLTLESKVNFLFFLLHHFSIVRIVLTFLTHCSLRRIHQTALHQTIK